MPGSGVIRRFPDAATARVALLVGRGLMAVDSDALPASVRAGIRETFGEDLGAEAVVQRIIEDVRARGDAALRHFTRAFDHADVTELHVSTAQIDQAVERVGEQVMCALQTAAERIRAFHEHGRRKSWLDHTPTGGALGQLIRPLDRVAVYAPGGRAPYPSSVLMAAVPARRKSYSSRSNARFRLKVRMLARIASSSIGWPVRSSRPVLSPANVSRARASVHGSLIAEINW